MALSDWLPLVAQKLRDTAGKLAVPELVPSIGEAVNTYSRLRPRQAIAVITGTGTAFTFSLPDDFEDGFSVVTHVEYPVGQQIPEFLEECDWSVRPEPNAGDVRRVVKLHVFTPTFPSAATAHVHYRARHVVHGGDDTVPLVDRPAVAGLAAAFSARELAAYYAQTSDPSLAADAVSYRTKSQEYIALAKELEAAYVRHMTGTPGAASVSRDLDVTLLSPTMGYDRFYHSGRGR